MALLKRSWLRALSWNAIETLGTRVGDALVSILLIRALAPEIFASLVLAQAYIAPALFFLISPGNTVYRFYTSWEKEGASSLRARLSALRNYGRWIWIGAVGVTSVFWVAGAIADLRPWIWAWTLVLGTFLSGADRDFLKLSLRMRAAAFLSVVQKLLLVGLILSWQRVEGNGAEPSLTFLVLGAALIQFGIALMAQWSVERVLKAMGSGAPGTKLPTFLQTLKEVSGAFAFPNHCANILTGWVQSLDFFVMGLLGVPAGLIGLYSVAVKFANFAQVIPNTLINTFSVWTGRGTASPETESRILKWGPIGIALCTALAVGVAYLCKRPLLEIASKGRWGELDYAHVESWLVPLLFGVILQAAVGTWLAWLALRKEMTHILFQIFIPWFVVSALTMVIQQRVDPGPASAARMVALQPVVLGIWMALWAFRARSRRLEGKSEAQ